MFTESPTRSRVTRSEPDGCSFDAASIAADTACSFEPTISFAPLTTICGVYAPVTFNVRTYAIWRCVAMRDENGSRQPRRSQ